MTEDQMYALLLVSVEAIQISRFKSPWHESDYNAHIFIPSADAPFTYWLVVKEKDIPDSREGILRNIARAVVYGKDPRVIDHVVNATSPIELTIYPSPEEDCYGSTR